MKRVRLTAIFFLAMVGVGCLLAGRIAPGGYAHQFRDMPDAACSSQHWLGTDDLGRDRFARLLYGTRVSLMLAPAAALLSTLLAALIGGTAGFAGGWLESCVMSATDLVLSLPWFFLLITVRAILPLNVDPQTSVAITFALLGCLGWAGAARVICADARALRGVGHGAAGAGFGDRTASFAGAPRSAQSAHGVVCAVLDFDSGVRPRGSESRHSGAGRGGAAAIVGQPVARTGELHDRVAPSRGSLRRWFC